MVERLALSQFLELDIDKVAVEDGEAYPMAGVLSAGRGLFDRGPMAAEDTRYPALHRLRTNHLVMRKLTAWEGPICVVPQEFDGYFVSTEFPTFAIDADRIHPQYMALICQTPWLWNEILMRSTGSVLRRKRLSPSALLSIEVPVPSLEDQERLVDRITSLDAYRRELAATSEGAQELGKRLRSEHFEGAEQTTTAGASFEIVMGRQRSPKHEAGDHLVPYLRAANVKDGRLELEDVKMMNFTPDEQERFCLLPGDVLVTEGCGSPAQLGASAVFDGEVDGPVCFQNTLLRVRGRADLTSNAYAYQWARWAFESDGFVDVASGTNILHIGSERAKAMPMRLADPSEQAAISALAGAADAVAAEATTALEAADALRAAILSTELNLTVPVREVA